jgi:hypothetical protein
MHAAPDVLPPAELLLLGHVVQTDAPVEAE